MGGELLQATNFFEEVICTIHQYIMGNGLKMGLPPRNF
jgi:hypothetical protein